MNDQPEEEKPWWWGSLPTVEEILARPRRTPTAHQLAALAEAAAVYQEGGEAALAAHLEKQRQEKEARGQAANDPNAPRRPSLVDRLKQKPLPPTPSLDAGDDPGSE